MEKINYSSVEAELLTRRDTLQHDLAEILKSKVMGGEGYSKDLEEQSIELENEEVMEDLDMMKSAELDQVNYALQRLKRGEYGICVGCGDPISSKRLKALPFAVKCIECIEDDRVLH